MTDLQDNIDAYDRFIDFDATPTFDGDKALAIDWIHAVIVDAARRVANPDYEAAEQYIDNEIGGEMAPTLRKWPNLLRDIAQGAVDAALGIDPPDHPQ